MEINILKVPCQSRVLLRRIRVSFSSPFSSQRNIRRSSHDTSPETKRSVNKLVFFVGEPAFFSLYVWIVSFRSRFSQSSPWRKGIGLSMSHKSLETIRASQFIVNSASSSSSSLCLLYCVQCLKTIDCHFLNNPLSSRHRDEFVR